MSHHPGSVLLSLSGSEPVDVLVGEDVHSLCLSLMHIKGADQGRERLVKRKTAIYVSSSSMQTSLALIQLSLVAIEALRLSFCHTGVTLMRISSRFLLQIQYVAVIHQHPMEQH